MRRFRELLFQFHKGTIKTQDGSFKYKDYLISIP